jgi:hypothetical protein
MWSDLPLDITLYILALRNEMLRAERAAARAQSAWRGYRTRVLLGRFRMLRYLRAFREWNPNVAVFLRRARL